MRAEPRPAGGEAAEHVEVLPVPGGAEAEFADFVRSSSAELGRVAWFLCGDRTRAEDLLQHAYLRTWSHWGRVRTGNPVAYTRRVLVNLAKDRWRDRARRVSEAPLTDTGDVADPSGDAGERSVLRQALLVAAAELPPRQRAVLVLRYFDELSVEETAAALGCSAGTVKSQTHHALNRLRERLAEQELDERKESPC